MYRIDGAVDATGLSRTARRWINAFGDRLYHRLLHGDKDTFALAFAAAGKAHCYSQVAVPPGEPRGPSQLRLLVQGGRRRACAALTPAAAVACDV